MPAQVKNRIKLFADDTKLYCRLSEDSRELQTDIDALVKWADRWLLPFNASKCKVMHIGSRNPGHAYNMRGAPMEVADEEKDLGIVIDKQLNFHDQASAASSKASQILAVVRRSFANIDRVTLPLLFKSMVRPYLEYGNTIWGPFSRGDQKQVERVQRRATKLVEAISHLPYPERLRRLGLPSLQYRRLRGDMITVYQLFHGGIDLPPETFLVKSDSHRTRGHRWKVLKPRAASLVRRNSFSSRVINDWNSLPDSVVSARSVNSFKARLDRHWAGRMFITPFT